MASAVPLVVFSNGLQYPILGLGTWKSPPGVVAQAVKDAIEAGYRHIDCAHVYGNEKEIGQALAEIFAKGQVKRSDMYITSKLWNTHHRGDSVLPALKRTLSDLQLECLDLYLIHWPMAYKDGDDLFPKDENEKFIYSDASYLETWKALEKCVRMGLVKSIGLSNFNSKQIDDILNDCAIKPVVNQVECHPYLNQKKLKEFCQSRGILLTAYSPLGSPDRPWAKPGDTQLLDDVNIKKIAEKYGKTTAQILIRYQVQQGNMVIPKSVTKSRIESNIKVFDFALNSEDMKLLDSFDCNGRFLALEWSNDHKDYPFSIEY